MKIIKITPQKAKRKSGTPLKFQQQQEALGNKVHFILDRKEGE